MWLKNLLTPSCIIPRLAWLTFFLFLEDTKTNHIENVSSIFKLIHFVWYIFSIGNLFMTFFIWKSTLFFHYILTTVYGRCVLACCWYSFDISYDFSAIHCLTLTYIQYMHRCSIIWESNRVSSNVTGVCAFKIRSFSFQFV